VTLVAAERPRARIADGERGGRFRTMSASNYGAVQPAASRG
jgi:hypothetical protein